MIDEVFELTSSERYSALWSRLLPHFRNRLEVLRTQNDGPKDATATAALRGQITVYKALIALNDEPQKVE